MDVFLSNGDLETAVSAHGAELLYLRSVKTGSSFLWNGDARVWKYRAPTLFPITGRLKDGWTTIGGERRDIANHGFARTLKHRLVSATAASALWELTDSPETLEVYPFRFSLCTSYALDGSTLTWRTRVENKDTCPMYFSLGTHTAFACPRSPGETREDYEIVFERPETALTRVASDAAGFVTGEVERLPETNSFPLSAKGFGAGLILSGFTSRRAGVRSRSTGETAWIHIEGFPYLVLWQNEGESAFVCVEPWHGLPDRAEGSRIFEEKPGIVRLDGGHTFECDQSISIEK